MKAMEENFREFITAGRRTFSIPVYQRNYEWREAHCSKLFSDIEAVADGDSIHFVGTIVYVTSANTNATWSEFTVIDGQQRITTVMLLLKAIYDISDDDNIKDEIWEDFLTNKRAKDEKYRLKLKPIDTDASVWNSIIEGDKEVDKSSNLWKNYELFKQKITDSRFSPQELFEAVGKLGIVYIQLEAGKENPQVIFESINSTGLSLTQGDLIRNFLLMNCASQEKQIRLYKDYWVKIEQYCTPIVIPDFVRDYLTMTNASLVNKNAVYDAFKRHAQNNFLGQEEVLLAELCRYAEYYSWFKFYQCNDKEIKLLLRQFHEIKSQVAFSVLLWFFDKCYDKKAITREGLISVIKTLLSYQYRRLLCKYSTNALNSTYAILPKEIGEATDIPTKLLEILVGKTRSQIFPRNDEFRASFVTFDVYTSKLARYTLAMLENQLNSTEKVELSEQITIEHIMPQTLSTVWKADLGKDFESIHSQWLHTTGNLTLSGNNSAMSNDSYMEKRKVYSNSNVALSRDVAKADIWTDKSIKVRAERLADIALAIWSLPEGYNKAIGDEDIDYSLKYNIMDDIKITGEQPKSYVFGDVERSVDSWKSMFIEVLKALYEFDHATYEKFITHEVTQKRHLAEPIGSDYQFRTNQPVEICKGYFTELNFSAQNLMTFMQIAVELYCLQDEVYFTLRRKIPQGNDVSALSELKVGQIAQTTFRDVLESGIIADNEIPLMMSKDYSKQTFNINYPLLTMERNSDRYYAKQLKINGDYYYLCKEWFEDDKPYLFRWLEEKQSIDLKT